MADTAPSLAAENAESGVVVTYVPATNQPSVPGGIRVVGLIGTGLNYKNVTVTVTRGSVLNGLDPLTPVALSLPSTITDQNYITYALGTDYTLSLPQSISGSNPSLVLSTGLLALNINGDGQQTIMLNLADSGGTAIAADLQVKVRALVPFNSSNAPAYSAFTATFTNGQYVLTSGTTPVGQVQVNPAIGDAGILNLGVGNPGAVETLGGGVNWAPQGFAFDTGAINVGVSAFPYGINLDGQTFEAYADGSQTVQIVEFTGVNISPSSFTPLTGSVSLTVGSMTVTGTGTAFLSQLAQGDQVQFTGDPTHIYTVASIASNLSLKLATAYAGPALALGYALVAATAVTGSAGVGTIINGDLDIAPNNLTSVTNFPPGVVNGGQHGDDSTAIAAQAAASAAFSAGQTAGLAGTMIPSALDGQTLLPGAYQFASGAATLATAGPGTLTFSGSSSSSWIIYTASTLTTGAGGTPTMLFTGGCSAANVLWVIGSSATINSGVAGTFGGNLIAQVSVTVTAGGVVNGSLAALTGAITLSAPTIVNGSSANVVVSLGSGIIQQMNAAFSPVITFNSTISAASFTVTLPQLPTTGDTLSVLVGSSSPVLYTYTAGVPLATQYNLNPATGIVTFNSAAANQFVAITYAVAPTLVASVDTEGSASFIRVSTTTNDNAVIQIGNGTANASLGFTAGTQVVGPKEPAYLTTYSFTYGTPKVTTLTQDDYGPALYTDLTSLVATYGPVATTNDLPGAPFTVRNTLPLGAQIVFTNSANTGGIMAVQCNPADGTPLAQFQAALNKLASVPGVNIVVCLTPMSLLYPSIVAHVVNCSQPLEGLFRTAVMGFDPTTTTIESAVNQASGIAASGNGRRFLMPWPAMVNLPLANNTNAQLDGSFLAAAIAGLRVNGNNDVATPLLRQQLYPFTTAATNLLRTDKLELRDGGVTVVELQNGIVRITEDTTTDRSTIDNQEFSVTEIVDFVATTCSTLLNSIFIGVKILSNTTSIVTATVQVLLNNLIALNILTDYQNVQVQVNALDPRQIDISFEVAPVYGLRYISVTFSLEQ
jgi:hypothetical protein